MYLKEIVREGVDFINLAQNRDEERAVVNTVTVCFSRRTLFRRVC